MTTKQKLERQKRRREWRKNRSLKAAGYPANIQFDGEEFVNLVAVEGNESARRFDVTAYSGGKLFVKGFPHPVVVDLRGASVKGQDGIVPLTLDHKDDQRVGHSDRLMITASSIEMGGVASASTKFRDEVVLSADDGFRWQASIEGRVMQAELVKSGQSVSVNGRQFTGPVIVARKFVLRAVSFVSSGGDEDNVVRLAASEGADDMNPKFKEWLIAKGFTPDDVEANENQCDFLQAMWEDETTEDETKVPALKAGKKAGVTSPDNDDDDDDDPITDMRKRSADEVRRVRRIGEIFANGHHDLQAKAIEEGWDEQRSELEFLRADREVNTPAIHVTDDGGVDRGLTIEAALLRSCGYSPESMGYGDQVLEASDRSGFKGIGIHGLFHQVLRAAGRSYSPGIYDNAFIEAAFEANQTLKASSGFSTLSLTGILSNIANKALLRAYDAVRGVAETIAATRDVNDFKTVTSYRLTGTGALLKVGADGEIKHTTLGEESYTNSLDTYARMLALTRQMIINDDLGAFMQIPTMFGRQAGLTLEKTTVQALLTAIDGAAFFTSGRGNLISGASSVLQISSLTDAEQKFDEQVDANGDPILLSSKYILTAPKNKVLASDIFKENRVIMENQLTTSSKKTTANNPHVAKWEPLSSPYFGTKHSLTGGDDDHWLLLADPLDAPLIEIVRLRGQRAPIIEQAEADFNVLGVQWRAYMDFGVGMQDYRAGVYSAAS